MAPTLASAAPGSHDEGAGTIPGPFLSPPFLLRAVAALPAAGCLAAKLVADRHGQLLHPAQIIPGCFPGLDRGENLIPLLAGRGRLRRLDRKSTRLNSSHL